MSVMRKGRKGCYECGKPTEVLIQVWMREYLPGDRYPSGARRQRTVKSINVSFCREHGEAFYLHASQDVPHCPLEHPTTTDLSHVRAQRVGR